MKAVAIDAALTAGALLKQGFGTSFSVEMKEGIHNLVTEYDKAAEKSILSKLKHHFPDHNFLAEESGYAKKTSSPYTWIIDPLDGTVNFAHQIPVFSVSIALAKDNELLLGIVFHPLLNELFVAEKGKGATLNDAPIHVTKTGDPLQALMATGFPYNVHTNPKRCIDQLATFLKQGIPVRRLGSAALDLAYVACGRFDAYWEVSVHPWDMAAGMLLVQEAGGKVTHYDGTVHKIFKEETILATNGPLHPFMVNALCS